MTSRGTPKRLLPRTHPLVLYALAVLLPILCSLAVIRLPLLYNFPTSLQFLVVVVLATLGGFGPAITAIVSSILARWVQAIVAPPPWSMNAELYRFSIMVVAGLLLGLLYQRRRVAERQLETALEDLQDRGEDLLATLTSTRCACWTLDLDSGQSARWFAGSYEIFGRPFAELEQMPSLLPLLHPDDQPRLPALVAQMRRSVEPVTFEHRVIWPNGETHSLEMRAARMGTTSCWRGVTLDITERRQAEAALLRAEKLAAMGRLASTVAHEINNPLEAVTNLLYLVSTGDSIDAVSREYLATAEKELARLSNITRLTLGFVRTNALTLDLDLAATVDDVLAIFEHRLNTRGVRVDRHYQAGVCVQVAPHELRQIATNLIANAADAIGLTAPLLSVDVHREGELAVFHVDDNGSGIEAQHLSRIFDPFFSTKADTGTGIGLWVTRELVEKYEGRIVVETAASHPHLPPGIATRFRVELPLCAATIAAAS